MAKQGGESGKTGEGNEPGADQPQYVTADDLARIVNAAVTTHTKRLETKLAEQIAAAMKPAEPNTPPAPSDKPDPNAGALAKLQSDLAIERKAREDEKREREAEREKAKSSEQSSALATALRDAGIVDKTMAKAAQALLESDKSVARDELGLIKFKTVDKYGAEALVDLAEGVTAWAKSDGLAFMPPRKVAGSGNTPPKGGAPATGKPDPKAEAIAEARGIFNDFLAGQG